MFFVVFSLFGVTLTSSTGLEDSTSKSEEDLLLLVHPEGKFMVISFRELHHLREVVCHYCAATQNRTLVWMNEFNFEPWTKVNFFVFCFF